MLAKRLNKELKDLIENPITNCSANLIKDDITKWEAAIIGPDDTPYVGGVFKLNINFPKQYPMVAPKINFTTKMFHSNIDDNDGHICLDILNDNWSPALSISKVLISICSLLNDPNPDSALNGTAAVLYKKNKTKFTEIVQLYIKKYCKGDKTVVIPKEYECDVDDIDDIDDDD